MRSLVVDAVRAGDDTGALVFGALATVLTFLAVLTTDSVTDALAAPYARAFVWFVATPVVAAVGGPPLVGVYARARSLSARERSAAETDDRGATGPAGGVRAVAALTVRVLRARGLALAAAAAVSVLGSLAVALVVAIALLAILLAVLTAAGAVAYALGGDRLLPPQAVFWLVGVALGLSASSGVIATRFHDCLVCFTDAGPLRSVAESVRFARSEPRTVLGYGLVTTALFAVPAVVAVAGQTVLPPGVTTAAVALVAAGCFGVFGAFHAIVFERRVLPALSAAAADPADPADPADAGSDPDSGPSPGASGQYALPDHPLVSNPLRVVLVVLLLTGLLVGTASIRALDVRPTAAPEQPGPLDPSAAPDDLFGEHSMPSSAVSHHAVERTETLNESTGEWDGPVTFEHRVDRSQRRQTVQLTSVGDDGAEDLNNTAYFSTTQFGMRYAGSDSSGGLAAPAPERAWYQRTDGQWVVYSTSGYYLVENEPTVAAPDGFFTQNWTRVETTADAVVLRAEGPDLVTLETGGWPYDEGSTVTVRLDRETGYVTRIDQELHADDAAEAEADVRRTVVEFDAWGTHEVERPAAFEPVRPLGWAWGVAYY